MPAAYQSACQWQSPDARERGELRQYVVATLAQIMRDCDDPAVHAEPHEVFVQMKVVRQ